jgi:hypothetical protein
LLSLFTSFYHSRHSFYPSVQQPLLAAYQPHVVPRIICDHLIMHLSS